MSEHRWKILGVTAFEKTKSELDFTAHLIPDPDKPWKVFFDRVTIEQARAHIHMKKDMTHPKKDIYNITLAKVVAQAHVYVSDHLSADHTIKLAYTEDLKYFFLEVDSISVINVEDFLPKFPVTDFNMKVRSFANVTYNSKTDLATATLKGNLTS